jgi:hypothetical protein
MRKHSAVHKFRRPALTEAPLPASLIANFPGTGVSCMP